MHKETFQTFWRWSDSVQDEAILAGRLRTVFGWTVHAGDKPNPRSLRNFPIQGNGAEMMRLACCLVTERGVKLCCPIHDALLIEAPAAERLFLEAEALHGRVEKEFANVAWGKQKLAAMSRAELHELRHLRVGLAAPEIVGTDLDGKPMRLSDFRDKVVVLDFWADWCGACQAEYPRYKGLVSRHAARPFAVLGVNREANLDEVRKTVAARGLNYPSWWDGEHGPIGKQWNIRAYPTVYVIDAKGVIRHKGTRGAALDKAVDELLAEMSAPR